MPAASRQPIRIRIDEKRFPAVPPAPAKLALRGVELVLPAGSFTSLTGPSGCGKTTLLNLLAGLDRDFAGSIDQPPGLRLGYVFQEPRLLPWRTVEENVRLVLDEPEAERGWVLELLAATGLAEARGVHASRLSLGMARRASLARAFAVRPELLLMDEPFVSLDEATAQRLRELLLGLLARHPATVLFVTHNAHEAVQLAERVVRLSGSPARVAAEETVRLEAAERLDPAAVEAEYRRLRGRLAA
jgi:NitT/TauT family transport system ATP-binding protein